MGKYDVWFSFLIFVSIRSGCYNKKHRPGSLQTVRHLFLTVLESGSQRASMVQWGFSSGSQTSYCNFTWWKGLEGSLEPLL